MASSPLLAMAVSKPPSHSASATSAWTASSSSMTRIAGSSVKIPPHLGKRYKVHTGEKFPDSPRKSPGRVGGRLARVLASSCWMTLSECIA